MDASLLIVLILLITGTLIGFYFMLCMKIDRAPRTKRVGAPLRFECEADEILLKNTEDGMDEVAQRWAQHSPEEALAYRSKLKGHPKLRRRFDEGAMTSLAASRPSAVLDEIIRGTWWKDQWKCEKVALRSALRLKRSDLAFEHLAATKEVARVQKIVSLLVREQADLGACLTAMWRRLGEGGGASFDEVLRVWLTKDPVASAAWVARQSLGVREHCLDIIVSAWAVSDPVAAVGWAVTSRQHEKRDRLLAAVCGTLDGCSDETLSAVEEALLHNDLEPETLDTLLNALRRNESR